MKSNYPEFRIPFIYNSEDSYIVALLDGVYEDGVISTSQTRKSGPKEKIFAEYAADAGRV